MIEIIAAVLTNKLVTISENNLLIDFPKYPMIEPINGKKITAYSI